MEWSKGGYREVDERSLWFVVVVYILLYLAPGLLEILGLRRSGCFGKERKVEVEETKLSGSLA